MQKENINVSKLEYELCLILSSVGFKYIARDSGNIDLAKLWFYKEKPEKSLYTWISNYEICQLESIEHLIFTFVKWTDEEPTLIQNIINYYERR